MPGKNELFSFKKLTSFIKKSQLKSDFGFFFFLFSFVARSPRSRIFAPDNPRIPGGGCAGSLLVGSAGRSCPS